MKKIFAFLLSAMFAMTMTSCVTSEAATVTVETEYYDYMNNVVVIYIDGIANYRFWDSVYSRYYYRPVPRERYGYIRLRPYNHHHNARPVPPSHRPHHDAHPGRPDARHHSVTPRNNGHNNGTFRPRPNNSRPDVQPRSIRPDHVNRPAQHSGNRTFGGRR